LKRSGDLKLNEVLLHALDVQHGIKLDGEQLLAEVLGDDEGEVFDLTPLFSQLTSKAKEAEGFEISRRWIISNFHFQKLAIVRDLRELGEQLAAHAVIAGIAGDPDACGEARGSRTDGDPKALDANLPDEEFLVLDADSTQHQAITFALVGRNGVISGPPGTGKSQTIANVIAELAARGKTALFVAEKRAALDVVLERLKREDLGHLCLDLHGADISRRVVAQQLRASIELVRSSMPPDVAGVHQRFQDRREKLNAHVRKLHTPRAPSRRSIFQLFGRLQRFGEWISSEARWRGQQLMALDEAAHQRGRDLLSEAASTAPGFLTGDSGSPWAGARLSDAAAAQVVMDLAKRLATDRWPTLLSALARVQEENAIKAPETIAAVGRVIRVLRQIEEVLDRYGPDVFDDGLESRVAALASAKGPLSSFWFFMTKPAFRRARAAMRSQRHAGKTSTATLAKEAHEALECRRSWAKLAQPNARPQRPRHQQELAAALDGVLRDLKPLLRSFPARAEADSRLDELTRWLPALASDSVSPYQIVRIGEIERDLEKLGTGQVLQEIRRCRPAPAHWADVFSHAWLSSCLEDAYQQEPSIPAFVGRSHDEVVREFQELDRERLSLAVGRVRRAHAERVIAVRNGRPEQDRVVLREAEKKTRHLPLRRLLADAPDVLLALRPCWMASPLAVSQLMPGDRELFDVVIFDEASQVLPQDAVTSLLRGRQAVVAGDRHQLPPTTFFAAGDLDEGEVESDGVVSGFESILDMMSAFLEPAWSLDWHYRSRDEALIAFSNRYIYGDRLVTFPGPGGPPPVLTHHHVPFLPGAGNEESASSEVRHVVDLVLEHARRHPGDTLGVIAMGIKHADRIEAALDQARRTAPELDAFFAVDRRERFFVKNLERVQGDERDAIILTIGYGKDVSGRLLYRFGPLLMEGGERRLNVAVTRARKRLQLVSSFTHHDMDPGRTSKRGVELLRAYLEYAARGGTSFDSARTTNVPMNDFEQAVYDALSARGLRLTPQLGASAYRLDLVAHHPSQPGRFVLAIECDGATYHSAPTARDRDRLRQQHLEALGWTFCRIWSTDWFLRRDDEISRVLKAYEEAVRRTDAPPDSEAEPQGRPAETRRHSGGAAPRRSTPPVRGNRDSITDYSEDELVAMVNWVCSDGLLTDDQIVREVARALEFQRLGGRIDAAIRAAIRRSEARRGASSFGAEN
jgi:very-short-patch-repair endonuclease